MMVYTYIDGNPINPGWQAHSWRSWQNFHYYNTHSLGPMMHITGLRPTRVTAFAGMVGLSGYPGKPEDHMMGGIAPSLITMSNGAVVRNLMGATTNDTHMQRIWGTLGAAESEHSGLKLRLGASGRSPKFEVVPKWEDLGEVAAAKALTPKSGKSWVPKGFVDGANGFVNLHENFGNNDGLAYAICTFYVDEPAEYDILLGNDGAVRLFHNGKTIFTEPIRINPAKSDRFRIPVKFKKGKNEILLAMDMDGGKAWGFYFRFALPTGKRRQRGKVALPKVLY